MTRARDIADFGSVSARLDTVGGSSGALSNRNLIINGAMQVAARGTISAIQSGYGACDRFRLTSNSAARFDTSQSSDVPSGQGFSNSFKLDCSTADTSLAAGDLYTIQQLIEGQNLQHLLYGTSSAKQMTLSFWVKSPKTGIHNLEVESVDGGVFNIYQYTIASANTWQKVSFTFDGYQTTAIANDNTAGLNINWWLLAGSTFTSGSYSANTWHSTNANRAVGQINVADSTSNNFYLTGVQLEVGDTETPFEHKPEAATRIECERYFVKGFLDSEIAGVHTGGTKYYTAAAWSDGNAPTPRVRVQMRAAPTITLYNGTTSGQISQSSGAKSASAQDVTNCGARYIAVTGGTGGSYCYYGYVFDAEL